MKAFQSPVPRWARVLLSVSYGLLLLAQVMTWFPVGRRFHALGVHPLAGLLFGGCVLALAMGRVIKQLVPAPTAAASAPT